MVEFQFTRVYDGKILLHDTIAVYRMVYYTKFIIIMLIYGIQYVIKNDNYDVMIVFMDITILYIQYHI